MLKESVCCDILRNVNRLWTWLLCTAVFGIAFTSVLSFVMIWRKLRWRRMRHKLIQRLRKVGEAQAALTDEPNPELGRTL